MRSPRPWWVFGGILGCGVGAALWLGISVDSTNLRDSEQVAARQWTEGQRKAMETVIEQVSAQSRGDNREVRVEGAPRRVRMPDPVGPRIDAPAPSPPQGYTFVQHHGDVPTEPFQPRRGTGAFARDDGLDWLGSADGASRVVTQAATADRDWSFGWIRLSPDSRPADVTPGLAALEVVVEGSAGPLIRARLPADSARLESIVALSGVDAVGAAPATAKLPPEFASQALAEPAAKVVPVFVTLMANDRDGRWRFALERLGAEVGAYDADTRAYVANVEYGRLSDLAEADFVLFVEPVGIVEAAHDTAVPAMGADALRTYGDMSGTFTGTGGSSVPVAVMDTGLNVDHVDIVTNRDSICGANFVTGSREQDQDLWFDARGHGTHVTGTIVGNGTATPSYAGMAPLVRDIRFAKVLNSYGSGSDTTIFPGMDFLSQPTECSAAGWSSDPRKPLIVNMSLSGRSLRWEGRDQAARKVDSVVWGHRQLYVVSQSNASIYGFSNYGAAKNSLPVGATLDSGEPASFTSLGPTSDGRLAPLVVGAGVDVYSAEGGGSRTGYGRKSGTSMSSPAVAGVAALLMDAVPTHREHPALTRARLMASAVKPDAWLEHVGAFPADNSSGPGAVNAWVGLGKVSAQTSILNRDRSDGWTSGSFTAAFENGSYAYHDIEVPSGASRLDVVLTWDEPPTDAIAQAVINDLDLWLDHGGDCILVQCGERSSVSIRDNVEWVIVRNPRPGTWRAKVAATRIYTGLPRAAVAWTVIRGSATPELEVTADKDTLDSGGELTVTVTVDAYVAAGTRLQLECRRQPQPDESVDVALCSPHASYTVTNADGLVTEARSVSAGGFVPLGEIAAGESREVRFHDLRSIGSGSALHLTATSWNGTATSISVAGNADTTEDWTAIEPPANDAFAGAELLEGAEGSRQVDMLHATSEPGEPDYRPGSGRPAGSVWYRWRATAAGSVHFGASFDEAFGPIPSYQDHEWEVRFDVLQGNSIAGASRVASAPWGASFFALPGQEYLVRISHRARAPRISMHWRQGARPENDAFASATAISEGVESTAGSNLGATLEPGEYFGGLGGTVWYTWSAPEDGFWEFQVSARRLKVLVFSGESVGSLRLVSGYPDDDVSFPARAGESYRIAVASRDALGSGSRFDLSWSKTDGGGTNDAFAEAEERSGVEASAWSVQVNDRVTVQPDEPVDSGVRTRWYSWTAPKAGGYTWRLVGTSRGIQLAAFSGDSLETLSSLGVADDTDIEFSFPAEADQPYRFAVGMPPRHASAFTRSYLSGTVEFGPTPANDALSAASTLTRASGRVRGSNRYATTEPHERIRGVGHSSVWWTFVAPAAGWYRFRVDETHPPFALAAFVHATVPAGQLELIASSRQGPDSGPAEIVFQAAAGDRFAIRLGTLGDAQGGNFTLHWEETETPTLLRYLDRFTPESENANGETVAIADLDHVAIASTGTALYVASDAGLSVLARDTETGALTSGQWIAGDLGGASLFWDQDNTRLLAFDGCSVKVYAAVDGTYRRLRSDGTLSVTGASACHIDRVFTVPGFLYVVNQFDYIRVFAYGVDSTLRHIQSLSISIRDAVLSNAGQHVYAIGNFALLTLQREEETGELTEVHRISLADQGMTLAVSDDDDYLFTFGRIPTVAFSLEDPAAPRLLESLRPPTQGYLNLNCRLAVARNERHAADAFCTNSAYAAQWNTDSGRYAIADFVSSWQANSSGDQLPAFGVPTGVAASPEGRHAYVSTDDHGVLIFERVGNPIVDVAAGSEGGYVRLGTLTVSVGQVTFGPLSSNGCITIEDLTVNGITYDVDVSKWQTRLDPGVTWVDVDDTEKTGQVCAYTPTESGQYRMAVEMDIDDEPGKYASNVIVVE